MNRTKKNSANDVFLFWACLLQITVPKPERKKASQRGEIWENLKIIEGKTAKEAYAKAMYLGKWEAASSAGSKTMLDGKPSVTKFLGISSMGLIHDDVADGSEICFRQWRSTIKTAGSRMDSKRLTLARLEKEMRPYKIPPTGQKVSKNYLPCPEGYYSAGRQE